MALTLAEAFDRVERLRHTRAVWLEVVDHLRVFVDDEVRKASKGISSDGRLVPQSIVRDFINDILLGKLGPLNLQIETLEKLSVEEKLDDEIKPEATSTKESYQGTKKERKEQDQADSPVKRTIASPKRKTVFGGNGNPPSGN